MTFDEIAIKNETDKSSLSHNYSPLYERHLPKSVNKFLEIGVWRGSGIKTFKEWYNGNGTFYVIDRFIKGYGLITIPELQAIGINAFEGDQDEMWFLETIKEQFTVIVDDASHHWDSQINTFKRMFLHNLEPGGLYVCEDVFDDGLWGRGIVHEPKDNLMGAFRKCLQHGEMVTQLINQSESDAIFAQVAEVNLYKNIIFVKKK